MIGEQIEKAKAAGAVFDRSEQEFLHHQPGEDAANPKFRGATPPAKQTPTAKRAKAGISQGIKQAVREKKQEQGAKGPALTFAEFKKAVAELTDEDEEPSVREFAEKTLAFCRGDISRKQWDNAVTKLAGVGGK